MIEKNFKKEIFMVGNVNYRCLTTFLFYIGLIPIVYWSYNFARYVKMNNYIVQTIQNLDGSYSVMQTNNTILGVIAGVLIVIVFITFWKVLCELLYLIFEVFKNKANNK